MTINDQASAIYNNILSGLRGMSNTSSISLTQIEDEIIIERMKVIKELIPQRAITASQLMQIIPNIKTVIKSTDRDGETGNLVRSFEIPRLVLDFNEYSIGFIGTNDRSKQFKVYIDNSYTAHKHNPILNKKPYVWIDITPNINNMYDCYLFNAPLMKSITVRAVFSDPREIMLFDDLKTFEFTDNTMIANEVIKRLTEKYLRYYRQFAVPPTANDQVIK